MPMYTRENAKESRYFKTVAEIANRYGAAWPEQRDSILAEYKAFLKKIGSPFNMADEEQITAFVFKQPPNESIPQLKERLNNERASTVSDDDLKKAAEIFRASAYLNSTGLDAWARYVFDQAYCPIFTVPEIFDLFDKDVTITELKAFPPVFISAKATIDHESGPYQYSVSIAGVPTEFFIDDIQSDTVKQQLNSLAEMMEKSRLDRDTSFIGTEGDDIRVAYRAFATTFWTWYEGQLQKGVYTARSTDPNANYAKNGTFRSNATSLASLTHHAIVCGNQWQQGKDLSPYIDETDGKTQLRYEAPGIPLLNVRSGLDADTSTIHDLIMGKWLYGYMYGELTNSGAVRITVEEILELRKRKKHVSGGFRREQKIETAKHIQSLESLTIKGEYITPLGKKHRISGRLLNLTIDEEVDLAGESTPFAFFIKPGDAVWDHYVDQAFLADYYQVLATYDLKNTVEKMANLIGRYLLRQFRIRQVKGTFDQPYKVKTILDQAAIEIQTNYKYFTRFQDYFDQALDRLVTDEVIACWQYRDDPADLPTRGWFQPWLQYRLEIVPPDDIINQGRIRTEYQQRHIKSNQRKALLKKSKAPIKKTKP